MSSRSRGKSEVKEGSAFDDDEKIILSTRSGSAVTTNWAVCRVARAGPPAGYYTVGENRAYAMRGKGSKR